MKKTIKIRTGATIATISITDTVLANTEATVTMESIIPQGHRHTLHRAGEQGTKWMARVEAHIAGFLEGCGTDAAVARERAAGASFALFAWEGTTPLVGRVSSYVKFVD